MNNPNGPYPGRQVFIGKTKTGKPCFAYLVTGRSPQSRERRATQVENSVIMGPLGDEPYDWLRHYTAIKYDNDIGMAVVTNGIQTEAIYETYKLIYHTDSPPVPDYLAMILNGARSEPDSLQTPRPAGVITNPAGKNEPEYIIGIKIHNRSADVFRIEPQPGTLTGIATYGGNMESPVAFDIEKGPAKLDFTSETPEELARYIYDISEASHQGDDIRVCGIGGMRSADNSWKLAIINRHRG
jgi:IMP cyclohydrolase